MPAPGVTFHPCRVDVFTLNHYIAALMELLLLLSALLSTLTGAISGVRAPEVQRHQTSVQAALVSAPLAAARQTAQVRPSQPALTLVAIARVPAGWAAWAVSAAVPLYADRLRE